MTRSSKIAIGAALAAGLWWYLSRKSAAPAAPRRPRVQPIDEHTPPGTDGSGGYAPSRQPPLESAGALDGSQELLTFGATTEPLEPDEPRAPRLAQPVIPGWDPETTVAARLYYAAPEPEPEVATGGSGGGFTALDPYAYLTSQGLGGILS